MTTKTNTAGVRFAPFTSFIGAPRVVFSPNEDGTPTAEETAAAAAAKEAEEAAAREAAEKAKGKESDDPRVEALEREKAELLREVMKRKDAEKQAKEALAAYEGIDPVKAKELAKAAADAEKAAAETRGDFERVKAMMAEEAEKDKAKLRSELEELRRAREADAAVIDRLTIGSDFSASTYIRENLTLTPTKARALYGAHFETKDGVTIGYDKPAGAPDRTPLVDASGRPLPFDKAFERIIDADPDKDTLLKSKITPGGGSRTTEEKGNDKPKDTLFGMSRIAASLQKGE